MTNKELKEMNPFERIEHELSLLEGCDAWDGNMFCPSCNVREGRRHALNCSIRIIRDQFKCILHPRIWVDNHGNVHST